MGEIRKFILNNAIYALCGSVALGLTGFGLGEIQDLRPLDQRKLAACYNAMGDRLYYKEDRPPECRAFGKLFFSRSTYDPENVGDVQQMAEAQNDANKVIVWSALLLSGSGGIGAGYLATEATRCYNRRRRIKGRF